jgi:hypothetical protein
MRFKAGFTAGFAAGYVLGAKAGQERYQKIVETAKSLRDNPGVQRLTGEVNKTVSIGKDRVTEAAAAQASKAKEAVANVGRKGDGGDGKPDAGTPPTTMSGTGASSGTRSTSKP